MQHIVFETEKHYVITVERQFRRGVRRVFEVYANGPTCATRVGVIDYLGQKGLNRAKQLILERERV